MNNVKLVYRVERFEGTGPYEVGAVRHKLGTSAESHRPRPNFRGLRDGSPYSFGFESLEDLHAWFGPADWPDLEFLGTLGFGISTYAATTVVTEPLQCIFLHHEATRQEWSAL